MSIIVPILFVFGKHQEGELTEIGLRLNTQRSRSCGQTCSANWTVAEYQRVLVRGYLLSRPQFYLLWSS